MNKPLDIEAERARFEAANKDKWWPWAFKLRTGEFYQQDEIQLEWNGWLAAKRDIASQAPGSEALGFRIVKCGTFIMAGEWAAPI